MNRDNNNNNKNKRRKEEEFKQIYTQDELKRLYTKDIIGICKRLCIPTKKSDTKDELIKKIISLSQQIQQIQMNDSDMNQFNLSEHGFSLPLPIILNIITMAYNDADTCTCIISERLHDWEKRDHLIDTFDSGRSFESMFGCLLTFPKLQQYWIKDQMLLCPVHKFVVDCNRFPSFSFFDPSESTIKNIQKDTNHWKRSMSTISKGIHSFISKNLFTTITMTPTIDFWQHIKDPHCIIKKPTNLYINSLSLTSSDSFCVFPEDNILSQSFFQRVEKMSIDGSFLLDNIRKLSLHSPKLRSIICLGDGINNSLVSMKELFHGFQNLTSINFLGSKIKPFDIIRAFPKRGSIRKFLLPFFVDWRLFDISIKQKLESISFCPSNASEKDFQTFYWICNHADHKVDEFPNLKHVHLCRQFHPKFPNLKQSIKKVTLDRFYHKLDVFFKKSSPVRKLRVIDPSTCFSHFYQLEWDQTESRILIIHKLDNIDMEEIDNFYEKGFKYSGYKYSTTSQLKSFKFISFDQIDEKPLHWVLPIPPPTTNQSTTTISHQQSSTTKLPMIVVYQIIRMVWSERGRCRCLFDSHLYDEWTKQGIGMIDTSLLEYLNSIKKECGIHSNIQDIYDPLYIHRKDMIKSRLELGLISKGIYLYVKTHLLSQLVFNIHTECPKMLDVNLFKFTSISIESQLLESWKKVILKTRDLTVTQFLDHYVNFSEFNQIFPKLKSFRIECVFHFNMFRYLQNNRTITKLDLSSIPYVFNPQLGTIKDLPLRKLYLPSFCWELYMDLPTKLKESLTAISFKPNMPFSTQVLNQFNNLSKIRIGTFGFSNPRRDMNNFEMDSGSDYEDYLSHDSFDSEFDMDLEASPPSSPDNYLVEQEVVDREKSERTLFIQNLQNNWVPDVPNIQNVPTTVHIPIVQKIKDDFIILPQSITKITIHNYNDTNISIIKNNSQLHTIKYIRQRENDIYNHTSQELKTLLLGFNNIKTLIYNSEGPIYPFKDNGGIKVEEESGELTSTSPMFKLMYSKRSNGNINRLNYVFKR